MIKEVRDYIAQCPCLEELKQILINYLGNEVGVCSITEDVSYNPIISTSIIGYKECQFRFNLDCKLHWNEDLKNNIDNSEFFENFSRWLEEKDKQREYPDIKNIKISYIGAVTNGYIYMTESNEAIYRISCVMNYGRS